MCSPAAINVEKLRMANWALKKEEAMNAQVVFSAVCLSFLFVCDFFYISAQGEEFSSLAKELQSELTSEERKEMWEQGRADYMGADSFENIQKKLDRFLKWGAWRSTQHLQFNTLTTSLQKNTVKHVTFFSFPPVSRQKWVSISSPSTPFKCYEGL